MFSCLRKFLDCSSFSMIPYLISIGKVQFNIQRRALRVVDEIRGKSFPQEKFSLLVLYHKAKMLARKPAVCIIPQKYHLVVIQADFMLRYDIRLIYLS